MNLSVCGVQFYPPSFREMAKTTSHAAYAVLKSARIIEFHEYVSKNLQETMVKVQRLFDDFKDLILLTCMSSIVAILDPGPFFGALVVGVISIFIIEYMHGTSGSTKSLFLEKAYEVFIAQTALVSVNLGCKAIQSVNFQFFPHTWRDSAVSSMIAGLLAGATLAAFAQRLYALALRKIGDNGTMPK